MARDRRRGGLPSTRAAVLLLCLFAVLLGVTHAQMPKKNKPKTPAVKTDVPCVPTPV